MKLVTFRDIESSDIGMKDCVEWVAEAIKAKGDAILPPKISLNPGIEGVFAELHAVHRERCAGPFMGRRENGHQVSGQVSLA